MIAELLDSALIINTEINYTQNNGLKNSNCKHQAEKICNANSSFQPSLSFDEKHSKDCNVASCA